MISVPETRDGQWNNDRIASVMPQKLRTNTLAGASGNIDNIIPSRALLVSDDGVAASAEDHCVES